MKTWKCHPNPPSSLLTLQLLQLPIGAGAGLRGIVDLVDMRATLWREAGHDAPAEEVDDLARPTSVT